MCSHDGIRAGLSDEISVHELHWLEGEGSFLRGPPSAPGLPVLSLQMTDEDVVARVARMFGRKTGSWKSANAKWQRTFIARVTGAKAVAWMRAVRPLMGRRRQGQIDEAIASYAPRLTALLDDGPRSTRSTCWRREPASGRSLRGSARASGASTTCAAVAPTGTCRANEQRTLA
ncbi:MAG: hypothetical protein QOE11_1207 [Solirubrobacteraceae bacterium]|nr:hypothetical protein [Solirubrobacteraceae bacterium]